MDGPLVLQAQPNKFIWPYYKQMPRRVYKKRAARKPRRRVHRRRSGGSRLQYANILKLRFAR